MTEELKKKIHNIGIVPVVKLDDASKAVGLAKALIDGGIPCAEVTFRTQAAEQGIKNILSEYPEMFVGAGTVTSVELAKKQYLLVQNLLFLLDLMKQLLIGVLKIIYLLSLVYVLLLILKKELAKDLMFLKFFPCRSFWRC